MTTFFIQKVKSQLHIEIIMFFRNAFMVIIQRHNTGTEGEIVTIGADTELVTLIFGAHLQTVLIL